MKQKRYFISGPMKNCFDNNKANFYRVQQLLESKGYLVFNPMYIQFYDKWTREQKNQVYFAIIDECDGIVMLDGWKNSLDATEEYRYAECMSKTIYFESELESL